MEEALLIIGRERSGTTVVRATLATSPAYVNLHEAFSDPAVEAGTSAFAQYLKANDLFAKWAGARHRPQILLDWLEDVRKTTGQTPLVDVKQQYLNICDSYWSHNRRPQLIRFCYQRKWPVIHVIRRNKLAVLVSLIQAEATGVWNARHPNAVEKVRRSGPVTVPTKFLRERIRQLTGDDNAVATYLKQHSRLATLEYETVLARGGAELVEGVRAACEKIGAPLPAADEPPTLRSGDPDLRARITNYDEVAKLLKDTPYAWMLDQEKPPAAGKAAWPAGAALNP
jgi:LPS sulfotransferase NodH